MYARKKYILSGLIAVVALIGILFAYIETRTSVRFALVDAVFSRPCGSPQYYSIGTIDERFGISTEDFQSAVEDAVEMWEIALGKDLFAYDPEGSLKISLVYDDRQAYTDISEQLQSVLGKKRSDITDLKAYYEELRSTYESLDVEYATLRSNYSERLESYNTEVAKWNQQGGAPQDVYERLVEEGDTLDEDAEEISNTAIALEELADTINAYTQRINKETGDYNSFVTTYNSYHEDNHTFVQGVFSSTQEINIYQYRSPEDLRIVLAHELGHALGFGHVEGADSIMASSRSSEQSLTNGPSEIDITHAREICGITAEVE